MKTFLTEDFLLQTKTAKTLYRDYAAKMPIFDYHCHLPAQQIADDIQFENITQAWLYSFSYVKSLLQFLMFFYTTTC